MDDLSGLRKELVQVVGFTRRYRDPDWSLADSLVHHRRQCLQNYMDDHESFWIDRVKLLDQLADREGISLAGEESARDAVMAVAAKRRYLGRDEISHGAFHLRRYLASGESPSKRDGAEHKLAIAPWTCECTGRSTVPV